MKHLRLFVLVVWLLGLLTACGDKDSKDGKETKVEPTPTSSLPALTETYTSGSGIALKYPGDWFITEAGAMIQLSNADIGSAQAVMTTGQTGLAVFDPSFAVLASGGQDIPLSELLTRFVSVAATSGSFGGGGEVTTGEAQEITLGGNSAVQMSANTEKMDGLALAIRFGDQVILVLGGSATGEMNQFEEMLLAVAATITYTAP